MPRVLRADSDLVQQGHITLNPSTGPVVLTLQGPAFDNAAVGNFGLVMSYHDSTSSQATAGAVFRILRPSGQYQWQLSTNGGAGRLAMELSNDHVLSLLDPAGTNAPIIFTPGGIDPKITINGLRVATIGQGATGFVPLGAGGISVNSSGDVAVGATTPGHDCMFRQEKAGLV